MKDEIQTQKNINYLNESNNIIDFHDSPITTSSSNNNLNIDVDTNLDISLLNNSDSNSEESDFSKKDRKKRQPLSVAATNNMNKNNVPVLLSFD